MSESFLSQLGLFPDYPPPIVKVVTSKRSYENNHMYQFNIPLSSGQFTFSGIMKVLATSTNGGKLYSRYYTVSYQVGDDSLFCSLAFTNLIDYSVPSTITLDFYCVYLETPMRFSFFNMDKNIVWYLKSYVDVPVGSSVEL